MRFTRVLGTLCVLATLALVGCLGGGGDGAAPAASSGTTVTGVAATGAPMSGATITVFDATDTAVATTTAGADGSYTLVIPTTATAPFVVTASRDDTVLYSPMSGTSVSRVNVTPITSILAAQLSATGNPALLASEVRSGRSRIDEGRVKTLVADIVQALQPLLTNVGVAVDPISGTFAADGSGYDRVLNSLAVAIIPNGTKSSIVITVKAATLDEQPPQVFFASDQVPPALPQSVATATLPPTNTDAMIARLFARFHQCYALPRSDRVTGTGAQDTVKAAPCRELFWGNDPASFKNNGGLVSPSGAFSSLFSEGATGVRFSGATLQLLNPDGTMLISWRGLSTAGGVSFSRVLFKEQGGELKAIGNQYAYAFNVRAWSEVRDYLNVPALSYHSTGYDVSINNVIASSVPVFDRVVVTTPNGRSVTVRPVSGLSYMPIVRADNSSTGTSVVRMAGRFLDSGLTAKPRTLSGENVFWALNPAGANADWTDEEIAAINNVGRWKAEFFLANNPGTTPDVVQYSISTTRPLTTAELTQRAWAQLTPAFRAEIVADSTANGYATFTDGDVAHISAANEADAWQVPTGANAPTFVQLQGFAATTGNPRWNDNTNVASTVRKVTITCNRQSQSDPHCYSLDPSTYSSIARANLLQMIGYDANDMEWVTSNALYRVTMPAP